VLILKKEKYSDATTFVDVLSTLFSERGGNRANEGKE